MDIGTVGLGVEESCRRAWLLARRGVQVTCVEATPGRAIRISYTARERSGSWESAVVDDYFDTPNLESEVVSVIVANFEESFATKIGPRRT